MKKIILQQFSVLELQMHKLTLLHSGETVEGKVIGG
jgi:hypothetical protein